MPDFYPILLYWSHCHRFFIFSLRYHSAVHCHMVRTEIRFLRCRSTCYLFAVPSSTIFISSAVSSYNSYTNPSICPAERLPKRIDELDAHLRLAVTGIFVLVQVVLKFVDELTDGLRRCHGGSFYFWWQCCSILSFNTVHVLDLRNGSGNNYVNLLRNARGKESSSFSSPPLSHFHIVSVKFRRLIIEVLVFARRMFLPGMFF
jgi:hypothetical protein